MGAYLSVSEGEEVGAGQVLAKIPREASKTKDITGGLPRVAELFEARKPKECAVVTEIDGIVSFGADTRGKRRVLVTPIDGGDAEDQLRHDRNYGVDQAEPEGRPELGVAEQEVDVVVQADEPGFLLDDLLVEEPEPEVVEDRVAEQGG